MLNLTLVWSFMRKDEIAAFALSSPQTQFAKYLT